MTEGKARVTEGFKTEAFTGEVIDFGVKDISGNIAAVFDFVDGSNLAIFHNHDVNDFDIPAFMDLGIILKSLKALKEFGENGIEAVLGVDDDTSKLESIRTEPDVTGMTLSFDVRKEKWINNAGEEKINNKWSVVKAESNGTPAPRPAKNEPVKESVKDTPLANDPKPTEDCGDDLIDTWSTIVLSALDIDPLTEAGLMKAMKISIPDKTEQSKMNKVRRTALDSMVLDELIVKNDKEYSLA